jgi:hypothetical protein
MRVMKKICYFRRYEKIPPGAVFLCLKKSLVKTEKPNPFPVYEDVFVYEVESDPERLRRQSERENILLPDGSVDLNGFDEDSF